ncbi:adipocyte plasma membrane-associated protein-like [Zingiber officinale]|uniref:adipocyte plasma membrane-associated protein-like n=1 Tax=Zingiber officinale TaxID=94328 RepID=UPI001C4BCC58|nr:adipocyte plasma membrane-associated protein-like [Zingiber officinale]
MSRWLLVAAAAAVAVLAVYVHVSLNSPISPLPLRLPVSPFNFPSNNLLQAVEKLGEGKLQGPEDVYVDGDGTLYTATRDGWIKRMLSNGSGFEEWMLAGGGGLLGLALATDDPDRVLVCDAYKGLLKVGTEGVVSLASHVDGTRIRFADDLAEASDGSIYFSDASSTFEFHDWFLDFLQATPTGRLLKYDPETKATSVVLDGLSFANGVALSAQQDFVVVSESSKFRCLKHWLKGDNKGQTEIFIDNLPGSPDNIKLAPDGSFWIAILPPTPKGFSWIHASPTTKKVIAAFPTLVKAAKAMSLKGGAMVVNVGSDGKMRRMLDDSEGKVMKFVTSVLEFDDHLYLGSLVNDFVGKIRLK